VIGQTYGFRAFVQPWAKDTDIHTHNRLDWALATQPVTPDTFSLYYCWPFTDFLTATCSHAHSLPPSRHTRSYCSAEIQESVPDAVSHWVNKHCFNFFSIVWWY